MRGSANQLTLGPAEIDGAAHLLDMKDRVTSVAWHYHD